MRFWNRFIWWIAAFVAVASFLALTQTAQTSNPARTASSSGSSEPQYFTLHNEGESGVAYGVTENGQSTIYSGNPNDH